MIAGSTYLLNLGLHGFTRHGDCGLIELIDWICTNAVKRHDGGVLFMTA